MMFYGDFYVDKNGIDINTYDLPSINIEEDEFKKLYDLIKYKNADVELPEQMMEDINNSKSYDDFLKKYVIWRWFWWVMRKLYLW